MNKLKTKLSTFFLGIWFVIISNPSVAFAADNAKDVMKNLYGNKAMENFNNALNYFILFILVIGVLTALAGFYWGSYKVSKAIQSGASSDVVRHFKDLSTMFWNSVMVAGTFGIIGLLAKLTMLLNGYGL